MQLLATRVAVMTDQSVWDRLVTVSVMLNAGIMVTAVQI